LDYDEDKLRRVYFQKQQARLGDEYHVYAQRAIDLKIRQADNGSTMSMYVNDAIGFRMEAEVPLFYSFDCFGTCDAIGFRDNVLRISDLKTGVTPADMKQLLIYAGIFFFEYAAVANPNDVQVILRIYQNNEILELLPDVPEIHSVMSRIKTQAELIAFLREED
jgi:hypothetical protein